MSWLIDYIRYDWQFLIMFALLIYVLYLRPMIHEKRRLADKDNETRLGDIVARHDGLTGKLIRIDGDKLIVESGRSKERFSFTIDDMDTNFSVVERNKEKQNQMSAFEKFVRWL